MNISDYDTIMIATFKVVWYTSRNWKKKSIGNSPQTRIWHDENYFDKSIEFNAMMSSVQKRGIFWGGQHLPSHCCIFRAIRICFSFGDIENRCVGRSCWRSFSGQLFQRITKIKKAIVFFVFLCKDVSFGLNN